MPPLELLARTFALRSRTGPENPEIGGISYHNSTVEPGHLFFACGGMRTDGHDYIDSAIQSGAVAVVHSKPVPSPKPGVAYLRVADPRFEMAEASAAFHGYPSRVVKLVGVTGTNGKSTTSFFATQLLLAAGYKTGLLSTTFMKIGDTYEKNPHRASTPEAIEVQEVLRRIVDAGNSCAVLEATSHGLSLRNNRLGGTFFDAAVFTNLTHEHLEFHGGVEQYRYDKANLFRFLDRPEKPESFGVVNGDSDDASYFRNATSRPVFAYSVRENADLVASSLRTRVDGTRFTITACDDPELRRGVPVELPMPAEFNVENALAALLVVSKLIHLPVSQLIPYVPRLRGAPGRLHLVDRGQPFTVIVDFAHSPDSFGRLLPFVRKGTEGRLIVVFGSAGDRDVEKRSIQGRIADEYADIVILSDEDPRFEDPTRILRDIASGCSAREEGNDLYLIPDRSEAIGKAVGLAAAGDTVLLLGKGHEQSIEYSDAVLPWDEATEAKKALSAIGYQ